MIGKTIVEDVLSSFVGGQYDECEILIGVRFGKREYPYFMTVVVRVSHDAPKNVGGRVVSKGLSLKVEPHVSSFGDEFKALLDFPNQYISISYGHDERLFSAEEGQSIPFRMLEVDFNKSGPIPCDCIDAYIHGLEYEVPKGTFMDLSLSMRATLTSFFLNCPSNLVVT